MRPVTALVVLLASGGCGGPDGAGGEPPATFIALAADFRGFTGWALRFEATGAALPIGVDPGPTYVYAREAPPSDATRFPVGTIFIKSVEVGARTEWAIHAMVKRSAAAFNTSGAVGWEFFELGLTASDEPVILWRGEGPPSGLGYALTPGADAGVVELVCNDCHAAAWTSDAVMTPELAPGP
jgi:hypothetical protein